MEEVARLQQLLTDAQREQDEASQAARAAGDEARGLQETVERMKAEIEGE